MMPSAKIAMRCTAPPENMLNMPSTPLALRLEGLGESVGIDAGKRDIGAEPIDEQRAEREPDALLQVLGLGEGRKIQVRGKLFSSRRHRISPLGHAGDGPQCGRRVSTEATR